MSSNHSRPKCFVTVCTYFCRPVPITWEEQRCNKGVAGARTEAYRSAPRAVDLPCREGAEALYLTAYLAGPIALPVAMTTRWFVEVSPVDADTLKERYCVEAIQWQQALH